MPTPTQHKQQAEHNRAFTQHLDLDTTFYLDWIVTAAFYAALHFIEVFVLRERRYQLLGKWGEGEAARSEMLEGFQIGVKEIFARL